MLEDESGLPFSTTLKFTAAHRLLRKNGYNHVMHSENILDKYFKVFFVLNKEKNARLGVIASKKILRRAADRNRAKRIIREVFRHHHIKDSSLDLVVMVRSAYSKESVTQHASLNVLFGRIINKCAEQ